jgi:hypothetical protein
LEKPGEFGVKPCETLFTIFILTLWVLNERNVIHHPISLLDLEDQKLIEVAIALKVGHSETDLEKRIL